jgi:hypothetical protein
LKKYFWLVYNEKQIKIELEVRSLEKKKLMYQMNLLNHFKNNSNINLELFDMMPDFSTIYSDVNGFSELNAFADTQEFRSDLIDDSANTNNNNNSNQDDLTTDDSFDLNDNNKLINTEIFDLNGFKQNLNLTCLKIFEYFICFVYFIYLESKKLNQKDKIKLVKR